MGLPPSVPVKKKVNFDALPTPSTPCAFYQSAQVRRVATLAMSILAAVSAAANQWATYHFVARPMTVIYTVKTLFTLAIAFGIGALALRCLPSSLKDPEIQKILRREAGKAIQNGGALLPYPEIRLRFENLLEAKILIKQDIDALIFNEIDTLDFNQFETKHGALVLEMLEQDTKQKLADKFLGQPFSEYASFKGLKESVWVKQLRITETRLAETLFRNAKRTAEITPPSFTYEHFINQYGADCIAALPLQLKEMMGIRFITSVINKSLTVAEVSAQYKQFCQNHFGLAVTSDLLLAARVEQLHKMTSGRVTDYENFREGNGWEWVKGSSENPEFKKKAREAFLKMQGPSLLEKKYEEDRKVLEIELEECIDQLNAWAENKSYLEFKNTFGFKYLVKLTPRTQGRFSEEVKALLKNDPKEIPRFKEEMEAFGLSSDAIYLARWRDWNLDTIIKNDGPHFLTLLQAPKALKEKFLKETLGISAKRTLLRYPQLFRSGLFTPTDIPEEETRTFTALLESEIKDYEDLTKCAQAYGHGFYASGLCSAKFVTAKVAAFLRENFSQSLYNSELVEVPLPDFDRLLREKRECVAARKKEAQERRAECEERHKGHVAQICRDTSDNISDSKEKRALDEAAEKHQANHAALAKTEAELRTANQEIEMFTLQSDQIDQQIRGKESLTENLTPLHSAFSAEALELRKLKETNELEELNQRTQCLGKLLEDKRIELDKIRHNLALFAKQKSLEAFISCLKDPERLGNPDKAVRGIAEALSAKDDLELIRTKIEPLQKELAGFKPILSEEALKQLEKEIEEFRNTESSNYERLLLARGQSQNALNFTLKALQEGHNRLEEAQKALSRLNEEKSDLKRRLSDAKEKLNGRKDLYNAQKTDFAKSKMIMQQAQEHFAALTAAKNLEKEQTMAEARQTFNTEMEQIQANLNTLLRGIERDFVNEIQRLEDKLASA